MHRTSGASVFMTDGEPNGHTTRAFAAKIVVYVGVNLQTIN